MQVFYHVRYLNFPWRTSLYVQLPLRSGTYMLSSRKGHMRYADDEPMKELDSNSRLGYDPELPPYEERVPQKDNCIDV